MKHTIPLKQAKEETASAVLQRSVNRVRIGQSVMVCPPAGSGGANTMWTRVRKQPDGTMWVAGR